MSDVLIEKAIDAVNHYAKTCPDFRATTPEQHHAAFQALEAVYVASLYLKLEVDELDLQETHKLAMGNLSIYRNVSDTDSAYIHYALMEDGVFPLIVVHFNQAKCDGLPIWFSTTLDGVERTNCVYRFLMHVPWAHEDVFENIHPILGGLR